MQSLFGPTISSLETSMRLRVARQGLLAANLANVDTPGYRRVDLDFQGALERSGTRLERTNASHRASEDRGVRIRTEPTSLRADGNGVELHSELIEVSRNAGAFVEQASVLSRLLQLRNLAITGNVG